MTKSITFIRHAHSMPMGGDIRSDHERRLSPRGQSEAALMATKLKDLDVEIAHWYSSDAIRTRETLDIFLSVFGTESSHSLHPNLYLPSMSELVGFIRHLSDDSNHIAIVAHNPALEVLGYQYAPGRVDGLSTCGIFSVECGAQSWTEWEDHDKRLRFFIYPNLYV